VTDPADIIGQADRAAARGAFADARRLLQSAIEATPGDVDLWLRLAAMCRATGDGKAALAAVEGALAVSPLHFVALLMRANLLEKAGAPDAGEAYGRALAQRPAGALSPMLETMAQHAEEVYRAHQGDADRRLAAAVQHVALTADERTRLDRFRTNMVRITRVWHSEPTHYAYPGLIEREFHERSQFPWLSELEAAVEMIADEFQRVAAAEQAQLVPYVQYERGVPLRQWEALNQSRDWTAIHLLQNGERIEANARHCPETMALLGRIPQPFVPRRGPNAMFSLLAPGVSIPPHNGVANTRLVCHLPLIVPEGCWFRVGSETRAWRRGEAFIFDDTIEHEAANPSKDLRVVFICDVWHPGLSAAERDAVAMMMDAGDGAIDGGL
jgi:aspartyl/asparaginyl beta-hydroxylase (cupin superfamily)